MVAKLAISDAEKKPPRWRRWLQFRLRTLMLVMLILPMGLGWLAQARSKSQKAWANVETIQSLCLTSGFDRGGGPWLSRKLGIDLPEEPSEIHVCLNDSVEEKQFQLLMCLSEFSHLRHLVIAQPYRSASALRPIERFQELQSLSLDFGNGDDSDEDLSLFSKLPQLKQWEDLYPRSLSKCTSTFSKMDSIEELSLCGTWSGIDWEQLKNLRTLKIVNEVNSAKDPYEHYDEDIASIVVLRNLEELELEDVQISDEGVKSLAQLKKMKKLVLTSDKITDAGLATLAEMPSLQILELDSSRVTSEAVEKWRAQRPELKIKHR
ncbi:MAG: hypothetical protein ACO1RA_03110 [Planctomycetaceae bacterium]